MQECPNCHAPLIQKTTPFGIVYPCSKCGGRAAALPVVRRAGASKEFLQSVWQQTLSREASSARRCSCCNGRMTHVAAAGMNDKPIILDVCRRCAWIWFDAKEFDEFPRSPQPPEKSARDRVQMTAGIGLNDRVIHTGNTVGGDEAPDEAWQWLPAFIGLPVECDAPERTNRPWVTWAVAFLSILTLIYEYHASHTSFLPSEDVIRRWGFIPSQSGWDSVTILTSFFLHGGLFHLISNMYFLLIFGDNVEDQLGRLRYAGLLLGGHVAGAMLHGMYDSRVDLPLVGASAGISAVIAYYAIAFPQVRLGFLFRFHLIFRWIRLPAIVALVIYVLLQLLGAWAQINGFSNVSSLGHLGGLTIGLGAAITVRVVQARERKEIVARL